MVDKTTLLAEVKIYCEVRWPSKTPSDDPDLPYNGHGNTHAVGAVVSLVVDWIEGDAKAREAISFRPSQIDLADITGMAVHELTRFDFAWGQFCKVIESAGKTSLWTGKLDKLVAKHPKAAERFLGFHPDKSELGVNVKRVVQDLAKTILWAQSLAFLVDRGYKMPAD